MRAPDASALDRPYFAFALLIGVASDAYSSIFIASPVVTHWKEREHGYRARRQRITEELGYVPAYADGGNIEPVPTRVRRTGRLTAPQGENVSPAEFEQMKADLGLDDQPQRRTAPTATAARPAPRAEPAPESRPKADGEVGHAPDIAENEGVAPVSARGTGASKSKRRNRRHGRR